MSQSVSLMSTFERVSDSTDAYKYAAVIKNGGLTWWMSATRYETQYGADEAGRLRLLQFLEDLRAEEREANRDEGPQDAAGSGSNSKQEASE